MGRKKPSYLHASHKRKRTGKRTQAARRVQQRKRDVRHTIDKIIDYVEELERAELNLPPDDDMAPTNGRDAARENCEKINLNPEALKTSVRKRWLERSNRWREKINNIIQQGTRKEDDVSLPENRQAEAGPSSQPDPEIEIAPFFENVKVKVEHSSQLETELDLGQGIMQEVSISDILTRSLDGDSTSAASSSRNKNAGDKEENLRLSSEVNLPIDIKVEVAEEIFSSHCIRHNNQTTQDENLKQNSVADGDSRILYELSNNPSQINNCDNIDVFGEYVAKELKQLDQRSCAFVQKAIIELLLDAKMGKSRDQPTEMLEIVKSEPQYE